MKENKDHCNVGVLVGGGHDVQVVVLDESVRAVLGADQGSQGSIFLLERGQELLYNTIWTIEYPHSTLTRFQLKNLIL